MTLFNWEKKTEAMWDTHADSWSKRSKSMWDGGSRKAIVPYIERHVPKGQHILDIGCGDGYGSYKLHRAGFHVTGLDLSGEMIARAKERVTDGTISFLQGNVMDLPFTAQSFDGLMAINVLEWTETPAVAIKELQRVVRTDGLLFIGILGPTAGPRANSYPRLYGDASICNTMMPWEFGKLAAEHHLEYVDGFGVYKDKVNKSHYQDLPLPLQQSLAFMWVFMLRKTGEE